MAESFEAEVREIVARCFPHLTEEGHSTAVEAFVGYIDLVNDVYDALQTDPERFAAAGELTATVSGANVEAGQVGATPQKQTPFHV